MPPTRTAFTPVAYIEPRYWLTRVVKNHAARTRMRVRPKRPRPARFSFAPPSIKNFCTIVGFFAAGDARAGGGERSRGCERDGRRSIRFGGDGARLAGAGETSRFRRARRCISSINAPSSMLTNGTGVGCFGAARCRGVGDVFRARAGERCGDLARLRLRLRRSTSIGTTSSVSISLNAAEDWRERPAATMWTERVGAEVDDGCFAGARDAADGASCWAPGSLIIQHTKINTAALVSSACVHNPLVRDAVNRAVHRRDAKRLVHECAEVGREEERLE